MQRRQNEKQEKENFNPTLVQLEFNRMNEYWRGRMLFQSHIGAIRMPKSNVVEFGLRLFQSHIGAIRIVLLYTAMLKSSQNFNPTLVQLELCRYVLSEDGLYTNFNPTLVQLE